MRQLLNGNLIIIGGAEDKEGRKEILRRVCQCINKEKDLLLIATIASEYPKEMESKYKKAFVDLGVKNIKALNIENREEAFFNDNVELVKNAKLIFFTGGDQLRITSLIGGTPIYDALRECLINGVFIVGTSAGASVMSDTMIVQGNDDDSPRKCTLKMAPGLSFIRHVMIDQHFAQRGRIGRLLAGIAENPEVLGIGKGAVYFIDGSNISYTNVSELHCDEILSMHNVKLHILTNGNKFDLAKRSPFEEETN